MAPTPVNDNAIAHTVRLTKREYWTKTNIAVTAVFATLAVCIVLFGLAFLLHERSQKKKHLPIPQSDKAALLESDDKGSMFSRHRDSNVALYVDSEADAKNRRMSQETTQWIPFQVIPAEEITTPAHAATNGTTSNTTTSTGSGVSSLSRTTNNESSRSSMLSPVSPSADYSDLGMLPSRPRSTSSPGRPRTVSTTKRYYDVTPANVELPPIPQIVHTATE